MVATLPPQQERLQTYEDYARLPEGAAYQLIEGEIVEMTAPTPQHQRILRRIFNPLTTFVEQEELGETFCSPIDVYLSETNTPQPDIVFIATENLHIIGEKYIDGAPDLVVEVLSPSTAYYDLWRKKQIYEAAGVKEYWLVDPIERRIEVHANEDGHFTLFHRVESDGAIQSKLLPQLKLDATTIFA